MADSAQEAPTPIGTQKRPLEEPSSPSGPNDQPDAKRPALDKVSHETDEVTREHPGGGSADDENALNGPTDPGGETFAAASGRTTDKQGDTLVPDAPQAACSTSQSPSAQADHALATTNGTSGYAASQGSMPYYNQDESGWLHMRAIISSAEAATVIGKGGENVSQIRKMAGAKCTVSEYNRGAVERVLTVSGLVDAVAKAYGLIIRTINQEPLAEPSTPQSKTYPLRLLIPHILIGSIIGKQGVRIREIQELSGARLNASESCLPLCTERSLVVLGVADAVHIAAYYIGSTLVEQLSDRFGGPAASAYASRHGGPQGPVAPGGIQVIPYVPQNPGGQYGARDQYRESPHSARQPLQPLGAPPTPQWMGNMHQTHPHPQQSMGYGAGSPRSGYAGPGPQQAQGYGHAGPQPAHQSAPTPQQPMQGGGGGAGFPGQPITQQIFIPNDMVGAIIGKGGAKINEIRQLSGSVIKINEPQDNNNERLVTITGTQECNQMALYMLYSRLGESSKNSNGVMPR